MPVPDIHLYWEGGEVFFSSPDLLKWGLSPFPVPHFYHICTTKCPAHMGTFKVAEVEDLEVTN